MFKTLLEDYRSCFARDPAARNPIEVLVCYSGLHAIVGYRLSHWLWTHHLKLIARLFSQCIRWMTGIEIHPGAKIGSGFFIDHGMGVVIGETTEIGHNVTLYQGVTLGGVSWKKEKRHPTLEDEVVVGGGAMVLGPIVVGHHSRIGAGSVLVKDVPPHSTVVGVPGRVVHRRTEDEEEGVLRHDLLPDPEMAAIESLVHRVAALEERIKKNE
ncbi:MAG: serine O-acetyltransferase [Deltaproteobacteria bacterium RIFCSPLOWO2_02_FULL_50_16]|nr:MAG: serine O-acetyltransferase [Deltaproteobacteria bacterium GWA2_50_8]OGQ55771.1 MAG: serine O-acetyltransferase [Deltaproteobacteria bacterium RIFCSPLOWO2_02_FULL_50_16]OGQ66010.1 MAG: serine O-acetyltransferase [Deltaproteobacteria bacterium RIFCSPLOWO2_12_FULL_50_11]